MAKQTYTVGIDRGGGEILFYDIKASNAEAAKRAIYKRTGGRARHEDKRYEQKSVFTVRQKNGAGMARRKRNPSVTKLWRRYGKDVGKSGVGSVTKRIKAAGYAPQYRYKAKTSLARFGKNIVKKSNPGFNLHSLLKWGIIAGVGYFLFTRFVKPNLSSALSGIVPDSQMSWNYVNPSRMLAAQIGNPMGQMIRNMPITMGRGVY